VQVLCKHPATLYKELDLAGLGVLEPIQREACIAITFYRVGETDSYGVRSCPRSQKIVSSPDRKLPIQGSKFHLIFRLLHASVSSPLSWEQWRTDLTAIGH
jgi:hypothetical protein